MVVDAPTAEEVLPRVLDFIGGGCLVGHNVGFDLRFVCHELSLIGRKLRQETPAVDTLKMAKKLLSHLASHKLENIAHFLGAPVNETHRALADVEITVTVLHHLLQMAREQRIISFKHFFKDFGVEKPNYRIKQAVQGSLF